MYFVTIVGSIGTPTLMLVRLLPEMPMPLPVLVFVVFSWIYGAFFYFASPIMMKTLILYSHLSYDLLDIMESYSKTIHSRLKSVEQLIDTGKNIRDATEKLGITYEKFL